MFWHMRLMLPQNTTRSVCMRHDLVNISRIYFILKETSLVLDNIDHCTRLVVINPRHCVRHDNCAPFCSRKSITILCTFSRQPLTVLFICSRNHCARHNNVLFSRQYNTMFFKISRQSIMMFFNFSRQPITMFTSLFQIFFLVLHDGHMPSTWIDAQGSWRRILFTSQLVLNAHVVSTSSIFNECSMFLST